VPVGTAGRAIVAAPPSHTRIGPRPQGINAVFVEFKGRRWFADGRAVTLDTARMLQIGEHRGFAVYADRDAPEARMYIATVIGGSLVTPYSRR
jgi:hypothetical protein